MTTEQSIPFPDSATVVVIGAGIVGNCLVAHLSDLGWRNIVQIDKGPLPNPGGSTGHASNFIFPVDHNKEVSLLIRDSQDQYEALGVNTTCGGIEVARTEERMEELRRRMTSSMVWGVESKLVTPDEIKELVPFVNTEGLLGGFYTPSVSVVDSVAAGTLMRQRALSAGALTVFPETEVLDIEVAGGAISAVVSNRGRIAADHVVIACGVWSPRIGAMAGVEIPLTPAVHQMIDMGPIDVLAATGNEIGYPIVRDMDNFMYERQLGDHMEVGSYAHRPMFHRPDAIPSIEDAELSPTELPLTTDEFARELDIARDLMPEILSDAQMRYGIDGLLSLTPDTMELIGETEIRQLWVAAAVWIREGPGTARMLAEWMTHGYPEIDPHHSDISRFYPSQQTVEHITDRCAEHFNKTYGIVHPREQWESQRNIRQSPLHDRTAALGAVYFGAGEWERPHWYETNRALVQQYGISDRPHEWDRRWWSPIQSAEHLAMRKRVGLIDLTAFCIFDVSGPGVVDYIEKMTVNKCDRPIGTAIYTPVLTPTGGFMTDLTVLRLTDDTFQVITGGFDGAHDMAWFKRHLPADGSVALLDRTYDLCTIGVWGPKARDLVAPLVAADISNESFPFATAIQTTLSGIDVTMLRISFVGELGWEISMAMDDAVAVWDTLWDAGADHDVLAVGAGVYGTSGRIEKGYRLVGAELDGAYTPVEAGLARRQVKRASFIGKDAYLAARKEDPAAVLCTLTVDSHQSAAGTDRFMTGMEPILDLDGNRIVDTKGRVSHVTSAGVAPSLGRYLLMAYLPLHHASAGTQLQVMYMNELFPVSVLTVGATPPFDPENLRLRT